MSLRIHRPLVDRLSPSRYARHLRKLDATYEQRTQAAAPRPLRTLLSQRPWAIRRRRAVMKEKLAAWLLWLITTREEHQARAFSRPPCPTAIPYERDGRSGLITCGGSLRLLRADPHAALSTPTTWQCQTCARMFRLLDTRADGTREWALVS